MRGLVLAALLVGIICNNHAYADGESCESKGFVSGLPCENCVKMESLLAGKGSELVADCRACCSDASDVEVFAAATLFYDKLEGSSRYEGLQAFLREDLEAFGERIDVLHQRRRRPYVALYKVAGDATREADEVVSLNGWDHGEIRDYMMLKLGLRPPRG